MISSLLNSTIGPIGVDFGTRGLKLLQLRSGAGRWRALGACCLPWMGNDGQPLPGEVIADSVEGAVASGAYSGRQCVVSLGRNDVAMQSVRMPRLPDAELKQAVTWEAADRFGLGRDAIEVDFIRMGEVQRTPGESRDEVLIVAASREVINARLEPLLAAGLRPLHVDLGVAALARCHSMTCRRESDRVSVRALLEVGASGSIFVVLRGDQIALCKAIPIGGKDFDHAVAEHLAIEPEVARDLRCKRIAAALKKEEGRTPIDESTDRAIYEAVRALLERIVKEAGLCLRYYGVTFRGTPPERLILAGGNGLEPHFDELLLKGTKLETRTDDPVSPVWSLFSSIGESAGAGGGPPQRWAVAAGLSLRGLSAKAVRRSSAGAAGRVAA